MKLAIQRADGGVSIMTVIDPAQADEALAKWRAVHPGAYVAHREIAEPDIPADRTFRNAWGADLAVDMSKAREIHRHRMRAVRAPKLAALDAEYMRADETGDAARKAEIAARKQALRDVTADPGIAAATTPEALQAVWPNALRG
jgi:hypothetical protein